MSYTLISEETEQIEVEEQIAILKKLVKKEEGLVVPEEDGFYRMFLRGGKWNPDTALEIIRAYFTMRKDNSRLFQGFKEMENLIATTFTQKIHGMLAHRDGEGRRIYVFRPGRWNPDKVPFASLFCAGVMLCEMVAREERTQISGLTAIVDTQNFGWKQLRAISMDEGRTIATFFNISFPVWLHNSHILNAPRIFHLFFGMLRPFLSEDTKNGVVFHSGNLSDSMKNYFRLDLIPKDLGGTGPLFDNQNNMPEIRKKSTN